MFIRPSKTKKANKERTASTVCIEQSSLPDFGNSAIPAHPDCPGLAANRSWNCLTPEPWGCNCWKHLEGLTWNYTSCFPSSAKTLQIKISLQFPVQVPWTAEKQQNKTDWNISMNTRKLSAPRWEGRRAFSLPWPAAGKRRWKGEASVEWSWEIPQFPKAKLKHSSYSNIPYLPTIYVLSPSFPLSLPLIQSQDKYF